MEWLKNVFTKFGVRILLIIFLASVGLNIFFFAGKGIQFDQRVTNNQYQSQNQSQATLIFKDSILDKRIVWKSYILKSPEINNFLNGRTIFESLYMKGPFPLAWRWYQDEILIEIPEIIIEAKKKVVESDE